MNTSSKGLILVSVLLIFSLVLAACATATPEKIIETVVVEKEGETVIETVEVIVTTEPEVVEPAEEGPIIVGQGNLIPCNPLPPIPEASTGASLASISYQADAASNFAMGSQLPKPSAVMPSVELQQTGKIYRVGVFSDITTINYWASNGPDNTVYNSYMVPQRLALYIQSDKYFSFVPFAAESFPEPLAEEGDMWVVEIPIRQDILWSDGTAFTANDVAWTANTVIGLGLISGNWSTWYDSNYLDHMEAIDDFTVKIFYHTKPGLARHENGTLGAPILSMAYWEPVVAEAMAPIEALGDSPSDEDLLAAQAEAHDILFAHVPDGEPLAGGFLLNKWEQGAFIQWDMNPDFMDTGLVIEQWADASYRDSRGVEFGDMEGDPEVTYEIGPFVDNVIYSVYGSKDAAILALRDGEVDFVLDSLGLTRGLADQVRADPDLTVIENAPNSYRYLSFNVRRRPMNDCAFRQAVGVLIDKEFIASTILQNTIVPLYTVVAPANAFWYNPDVPLLGKGLDRPTRLEYAKAIVKQAGFSWEDDVEPTWDAEGNAVIPGGRLIMPDGVPVPPLNLPAPAPGYDAMRSTFAVWIETWLNEFGIPVTADLQGFNTLIPIIFTEQEFDMYILGWSADIFPQGSLVNNFIEEQTVADGNNAGGYVNSEYEDLAKQLLTCDSLELCREIAFKLQVMVATEMPYVVLFNSPIIEAFRSALLTYPWTQGLSGLQYSHQWGGQMMQNYVKVE